MGKLLTMVTPSPITVRTWHGLVVTWLYHVLRKPGRPSLLVREELDPTKIREHTAPALEPEFVSLAGMLSSLYMPARLMIVTCSETKAGHSICPGLAQFHFFCAAVRAHIGRSTQRNRGPAQTCCQQFNLPEVSAEGI